MFSSQTHEKGTERARRKDEPISSPAFKNAQSVRVRSASRLDARKGGCKEKRRLTDGQESKEDEGDDDLMKMQEGRSEISISEKERATERLERTVAGIVTQPQRTLICKGRTKT